MRTKLGVSLTVLTACGIFTAFAQTAPAAVEFEVASVKPNRSGSGSSSSHDGHGRVSATNLSLLECIRWAYGVRIYQVSGPDWLSSERYDIVAKSPGPASDDQLRLMLQRLFADRFKLKLHHEIKELSMYALVVGKNGPKLQQVEASGGSHMNSSRGQMTAQKVSMSQLADFLARQLDRPVVDRTEIKGVFDLKLEWTEESQSTDGASGPSIFTAVQEQLGLRLQAQKLPVEILVVDNVEKVPTEN